MLIIEENYNEYLLLLNKGQAKGALKLVPGHFNLPGHSSQRIVMFYLSLPKGNRNILLYFHVTCTSNQAVAPPWNQ